MNNAKYDQFDFEEIHFDIEEAIKLWESIIGMKYRTIYRS